MFGFLLASALGASLVCPSAPYGIPNDVNDIKTINICHTGYYTKYDIDEKDPAITVWTVDSNTAVGCGDRMGNFRQDPLAKDEDAEPEIYNKSGFDKGHIADAKDFTYNDTLETQTFFMTNMTPQVPGLNRGGWKWLETATRYYALKYGKVVVYSGPIFNATDKKLDNEVDIPDYFWKIIYVPSINKALSIIVPNKKIEGEDILSYIVSVDKIEEMTKFDVPLPSSYNKNLIADKNEWSVDFKDLQDKGNEVCKKN